VLIAESKSNRSICPNTCLASWCHRSMLRAFQVFVGNVSFSAKSH